MSKTDIMKKEDSEFNEKNAKKKSFNFKMPAALTIIIIILFGLVLLSWFAAWGGASYEEAINFTLNKGDIISFDSMGIDHDQWIKYLDSIEVEGEIPKAFKDLIVIPIEGTPLAGLKNTGATITFSTGETLTNNVSALGIFGVPIAMSYGFMSGADLIFYLFILGAVIELMLVSGSMEVGISGLVKGFNGKEIFLIPTLVVLFSAGGAIYGMSEESIALFVIVVPALSLAGFDAVTGMLVILAGTATGNAMSIVNPFNLGAAAGAIKDTAGGANFNQGSTIIFTLIWWSILTVITASAVTGYAAYVKKSPNKSFNVSMKAETDEWLKGFDKDEDTPKATGRQKGALTVFGLSFLLMILLFIPWGELFGIDYDTGTKDPITGGINIIGEWYFPELSMLFIVSGTIIALILGMGMDKTTTTMWAGAKEMFSVAIMIGVARGIPFIMESTGLQMWLIGGLIGGLKGVSPIAFLYISFVILLLLSTIITSTSGLAGASMGIFTAAVVGFTGSAEVGSAWRGVDPMKYMGAIVIIYMMSIGIMNFFVPTNPIVMASMQQSRVAYADGAKATAPIAGVMFLITLCLIIPSTTLLY